MKKHQIKKCFSYIRYSSTGAQARGDSERRQLEIAPRVAKAKGWELIEEFSKEDLGKSASKGDNLKTLLSIIQSAQDGIIPNGTVCIIEAFDRATRLPVDDAYQLIRKILKSGIEIYIDKSSRHLTASDLNNPMSVMMTVCELDASFQYTDLLKKRVKESWQLRREKGASGKITKHGNLTKVCPAWLNKKDHSPIREKVALVQRIFDLYMDGHGVAQIAKKLNVKKIKPFGRGAFWDTCYVSKLLTNPIVIGEFQYKRVEGNKRIPVGEPVQGYYPAIISEDQFYGAQDRYRQSFKKRVRKTGRTLNLFAGLAVCAKCGEPMNRISGRKHNYFQCRGQSMQHGCTAPLMSYDAVETSFLDVIFSTDALFVTKKEINSAPSIRGKIEVLQTQIKNITNAVLGGTATKALVQKQLDLEKEIEDLELNLKIASAKKTEFDAEKYSRLKNDIPNFKTNYEFRAQIRDFILANSKTFVVNTSKREVVITKRDGKNINLKYTKDYKHYALNGKIGDLD